MKVRKAKKSLRKAKKLEPTKPLTVAHNDFAIVKHVDVPSTKLYQS